MSQHAIGATLHTGDMGMDDILRYAREAESLGYEGFWVTEESGKEAFSTLALLANATKRIRLGTGIVNFYSRTPTLLAMGASTIYRLSGGRFELGLGSGGVGFSLVWMIIDPIISAGSTYQGSGEARSVIHP